MSLAFAPPSIIVCCASVLIGRFSLFAHDAIIIYSACIVVRHSHRIRRRCYSLCIDQQESVQTRS
jgi:hypothetical protein